MTPTVTQQRIPGTEAEIDELDDAAAEYAKVRDTRMALNQQESALKLTVLALMKKHKREKYSHDNIEIEIVHESENVKVRVKKLEEDED